MIRISYILTAGLIVALASTALANELPCGPTTTAALSLHFRPSEGDVTGYRAYVGRAPGVYLTEGALTELVESADETVFGLDGRVTSDTTWYVALNAYGPAGESVLSNELVVPATTRECVVPTVPELIEVLRESLADVMEALEGLGEGR